MEQLHKLHKYVKTFLNFMFITITYYKELHISDQGSVYAECSVL